MKANVIVVDDEPLAINVLKNYISQMKELRLCRTFKNALNASTYIQEHPVDIIFLDIDMPVLNGLDFLESLHTRPFVVITTAHEEYALKSFQLEAISYLLKPIPFPLFVKTIGRILDLMHPRTEEPFYSNNVKPSIYVKVSKKKMQKIYLDDIFVIESMKDYINIKSAYGNFIVHQSLSSFTDELPKNNFVRIHRSFTVALDKIKSIEANKVEVNGVNYTIGRQYLNEVKKRVLG